MLVHARAVLFPCCLGANRKTQQVDQQAPRCDQTSLVLSGRVAPRPMDTTSRVCKEHADCQRLVAGHDSLRKATRGALPGIAAAATWTPDACNTRSGCPASGQCTRTGAAPQRRPISTRRRPPFVGRSLRLICQTSFAQWQPAIARMWAVCKGSDHRAKEAFVLS